MWAELIALAYLGLACLARLNHRFVPLTLPGDRLPRTGVALGCGLFALGLGLGLAIHALGPAQGIVAGIVAAGVAGIALVLLLSLWPAAALAPTVPFLLLAATRRQYHAQPNRKGKLK